METLKELILPAKYYIGDNPKTDCVMIDTYDDVLSIGYGEKKISFRMNEKLETKFIIDIGEEYTLSIQRQLEDDYIERFVIKSKLAYEMGRMWKLIKYIMANKTKK
jgi:hypothetical protein